MLDIHYHPSKGRYGAAIIEAGTKGFSYNPSGGLPIPVAPLLQNAGAPTSGGAGTFAGVALKGWLCLDTTNGAIYLNTGTKASPTWTSFSPGLGGDSVSNGLTASTTQTLVGGLALTSSINRFTTVANANDAATLAALAVGQHQDVYNAGAHPMSVFPGASGATIDGGSAGAKVTLTNALRCRYTCIAANTIISAQLGAVSA
jgi:hypothetical protein